MNIADLGLADFNIIADSNPSKLRGLVLRAVELGYQTVAINTVVDQERLVTRKKRKEGDEAKNQLSEFPEPCTVSLSDEDYPALKAKGLKPSILTRLTIVITDNDFLIHYNKSEVVKKYDLLSIIPKNAQCLINLLKSSFRFDILSFKPELIYDSVKWSRKLYNDCVEKYIHFELLYAPAISDSENKRKIISLAQTYQSTGKSKKIFLSSGAKNPIDLRSPADVANLAFIFSLNENQGKDAVKKHCQDIHKAALGRKVGVYRVVIEKLDNDTASSSDSDEMDTD